MKIFVGADHNGYTLKTQLLAYLKKAGYEYTDLGDDKLDPDDDFPQFAGRVIAAMQASNEPNPRGILLCGSGQGMCMMANRYKGIRAALGYDRDSIISSRNDDDANVLCLPARKLEANEADVLVETFLNTPFAHAARYIRRIQEMDAL